LECLLSQFLRIYLVGGCFCSHTLVAAELTHETAKEVLVVNLMGAADTVQFFKVHVSQISYISQTLTNSTPTTGREWRAFTHRGRAPTYCTA
jgi:hypothetical protein